MSGDGLQDKMSLPDIKRFVGALKELSKTTKDGGEAYFRAGQELLVSRAPGRLDLMGGNDDYTGGLVFEATIREAVMVAIQARSDRKVVFLNPAVRKLEWEDRIEFSLDDLLEGGRLKSVAWVRSWCEEDPGRSWCAYILGDLYYLMRISPTRSKGASTSIWNRTYPWARESPHRRPSKWRP